LWYAHQQRQLFRDGESSSIINKITLNIRPFHTDRDYIVVLFKRQCRFLKKDFAMRQRLLTTVKAATRDRCAYAQGDAKCWSPPATGAVPCERRSLLLVHLRTTGAGAAGSSAPRSTRSQPSPAGRLPQDTRALFQ